MKPLYDRWRAIGLVLLYGVVGVLFGELIFQFAGDDGQAVDEDGQIEGEPGVVAGVHELTGDAENILLEPLLRFGIVFGRGLIEEDQISGGIEIDAFAENIDDAAFGDFAASSFAFIARTSGLLFSSTASSRRITVIGRITSRYLPRA